MFNFQNKQAIIDKCNSIDGWMDPAEIEALYQLSKKHIKLFGKACEIGTWKGKSSYLIGSICKSKFAKLYTIDTFAGIPAKNAPENIKNGPYHDAYQDPNSFLLEVKNTLSGLPIEIIKSTSSEASKKIGDNSLDFCFIDGNHKAPTVYEDIKTYLTKIKKGGVILGHDYYDSPDFDSDVKAAVDSVIGQKNITRYSSIWVYQM